MDLAVTLVDGGECISHLATLRQQPELFGKVASTPTDWRVLDSVDEQMLARLRAAVAKAGARVWERGFSPRRLTLDLDATLVEVESENKEQAAPNWKHGFGYHPQRVSLDQTGEPLGGILRPGNAGANTAQDHIELLNEALSQLPLPARVEDAHLGLEVLVGSDSARASHQFVIAHSPQENPSGPGAPEPGWVSGSGAAEAGAPPLDVTEPARRVRTRPR